MESVPEALADDASVAVREPYLLVTHLPAFVDLDGSIWLERLWHADVMRHLAYLRDFRLLAPVRARPADVDAVVLEPVDGTQFRLHALPRLGPRRRAIMLVPVILWRIWRAVGEADLVHSSMGGWPLPLAALAAPVARLRGRITIVVVESAPWRLAGRDAAAGLVGRARARVAEWVARWVVGLADLALFTNDAYRDSLLPSGATTGAVLPASWIPVDGVLSLAAAEESWRAKLRADSPELRVIFAGRLTEKKGLPVLLEALSLLEERGCRLRVTVIGEGALRKTARELAERCEHVSLEVREPVPYGTPFFELVRAHHLAVVPSVSDEQPRVVFDSYSQAVPLVASDTPGIRPWVPADTGWLVPAGDAPALAARLDACRSDLALLREMGLRALDTARAVTHERVHAARSVLIARLVEPDAR